MKWRKCQQGFSEKYSVRLAGKTQQLGSLPPTYPNPPLQKKAEKSNVERNVNNLSMGKPRGGTQENTFLPFSDKPNHLCNG